MRRRWLQIGIGIKRWMLLTAFGVLALALGMALLLLPLFSPILLPSHHLLLAGLATVCGAAAALIGSQRLFRTLVAPYRQAASGDVFETLVAHSARGRGLRVVAMGGGTGLPATLRGLKAHTSNITAVVTVADDGGSSGRLRRDLGMLPPGDLRNNIVALSDDESLMAQLFQYRFASGDLSGHAFGNLFIAALSSVVAARGDSRNHLADALIEIERVLNIRGRVLPATLDDIRIVADLRLTSSQRTITVIGESQIESVEGAVQAIRLDPPQALVYPPVLDAILAADLIVIGPGSLYTSIIPSLLVTGIADALRASRAYKVFVCNVATQPVETDGYDVADHIMALERHVGRGLFQAVLANSATPTANAGSHTRYVAPIPTNHEIQQRYEVRYTDLTDEERPWRHDPRKLGEALLTLASKRL